MCQCLTLLHISALILHACQVSLLITHHCECVCVPITSYLQKSNYPKVKLAAEPHSAAHHCKMPTLGCQYWHKRKRWVMLRHYWTVLHLRKGFQAGAVSPWQSVYRNLCGQEGQDWAFAFNLKVAGALPIAKVPIYIFNLRFFRTFHFT